MLKKHYGDFSEMDTEVEDKVKSTFWSFSRDFTSRREKGGVTLQAHFL